MTVKELIQELIQCPENYELNFWCPDGYEDSINAVYVDGNKVQLTGYNVIRDHFPKNHPTIKIYE